MSRHTGSGEQLAKHGTCLQQSVTLTAETDASRCEERRLKAGGSQIANPGLAAPQSIILTV
jgi:hypothetical protein